MDNHGWDSDKESIMENLPFLDSYSGQSVDELISLENSYRIDSLVLAFEQAICQKAKKVGMVNLNDVEEIILAVEALEREVNNGGYHQFFVNPSNKFVAVIVEALKRIGCPKTAEITQRAIDTLALSGPLTPEAIDQIIYEDDEERDDKLNQCDNIYYHSDEDIAARLFSFIKNHKEKITF